MAEDRKAHRPPDHPDIATGKIGVLLVNLGTPDGHDTASVRRYLAEFLSDPDEHYRPADVIVSLSGEAWAKLYLSGATVGELAANGEIEMRIGVGRSEVAHEAHDLRRPHRSSFSSVMRMSFGSGLSTASVSSESGSGKTIDSAWSGSRSISGFSTPLFFGR